MAPYGETPDQPGLAHSVEHRCARGMASSKQFDEGGRLQVMEADRVEEEERFESIDKLISQGINSGDVEKLKDLGIYTCNGLMMHTKKSLTGIRGLSEAKVDKICEAALKILRKSVAGNTTGSQTLDELLGGGIETPPITEAFGEFRHASRMAPSKQYAEDMPVQHREAYLVEEENGFKSLDKLILQGINAGDVEKLQDAGIYTCNGLLMHTKKSLIEIIGLSEAKVDKICEAAEKILRKSVAGNTTGSQALDELLGGGIETPRITEAFGEFRHASRMAPSKQYAEDMPVQHREAYLVEENGFKSLDKLISRSIRAGDVKKLHAAGIHTCSDLSTCSKKKLAEIKGFSEEKIDIILSASKKLLIDEYDKGSDLLLNGNYVKWIRTANKALEELRCGNLENHPTIHSLDNFRSEKTLLTHSLCVTSQIPVKGDEFTPKVVYIDTLGLFNPDCIVSIAESLGIDGSRVLENVLHIPADSFEKIEKLSSGLAAKISEEPFSLLIVDSVTPLLSTGGKGSMENAVCQSKLKHLLSHLANISKEYNVAVYVTKRDDSEMKLMDFKSTQLSQLEKICDDKEEESTISISVSTLSGFHCLNVNPSDTVSSLIKIVEKRAKLPLGSQYLTYRGKILKPGMRLGDCDMVVNSWFEANSRLLGGAPEINPAQTLSDFVAKDNDVKESMSDGVKVYNNKMAKEIIIPYPRGTKGYRYLVKVAMTPLSNSIFSSMLNKVSKAHAEEKSWGGKINGSTFQVTDGKLEILVQPEYTLDEVNAKEDYKQLSQLFWEYAELNGHHPIYLRSLCSYMDTATKALAQDYKFHLFLRIHPCLLTYSQRSSLFWEIGREFDGFVPSDQADFNSAVDSIIFPTGWRSIAIKEKIFYMTYVRRNYSKYSSDCFRFLRNWLTHGKVNFTKADSRTFNTRSMDYLIEIYFKDFFPDVLWLLTQKNFEGLNEWFCDLTGDDIHA